MTGYQWQRLARMDFTAFLGPHMVADIFTVDGRDENHDPIWNVTDDHGLITLATPAPGLRIALLDDPDYEPVPPIYLLADAKPVGFYLRPECWIDPEFRGRGLSAALIVESVLLDPRFPLGDSMGCGFSEAGAAAHTAAFRILQARAQRILAAPAADAPTPTMPPPPPAP